MKAISPLDGRYYDKISSISNYVSESALIYYRLEIEIKYLIALSETSEVRKLSKKEVEILNKIYTNKNDKDALRIKEIENEVKHDVKSIEIYLREKLQNSSLDDIIEKLHYCLTSEDINNIAYRLIFRDTVNEVILPEITKLLIQIRNLVDTTKNIPMMARTHGQDAIPTTFGKEMAVYLVRLFRIYKKIQKTSLTGKLNGAIGGWNAHVFANPKIDWITFSKKFVESFGLESNQYSTQINQYDDIIELLNLFHLFNSIILDFNQDMWRYISDGWIKQKVDLKTVGSSTMAQKVNPINFENSEGNIQIVNGLIETLSRTLPISRLQRDLSNSTVIRNISAVFAHELLLIKSCLSGLSSIYPNEEEMSKYLNSNWAILSEPLQILLRKHNVSNAYNIVKEETMGKKVNEKEWKAIINKLPIDEKVKKEALKITVNSYIGYCDKIAEDAVKLINI